MSHHEADVHPLRAKENPGNQPILVDRNVEHDAGSKQVSVWVILSDFRKVLPIRFASAPIPVVERLFRIPVPGGKLRQSLAADDSHLAMFPKRERGNKDQDKTAFKLAELST
jgi:hypothetical protein